MVATKIQPVLSEATLTKIGDAYGLKIFKVGTFRSVWRLQTDVGYKYLKRSKLLADDVIFIHEALEYLISRDFHQVPNFLIAKNGNPYYVDETGLYILTDWFFSKELDFGLLMDLKQATHLLAEFHQKSRGFIPNHPENNRTCWLDWPTKLKQRLEQLQKFQLMAMTEQNSSAFSRLYLRHFDSYYREALDSYEWLLRSPYLQVATLDSQYRSFCHHDYSGRNILRTFENRLLLVDFDYCLLDLRIHDLINLMVRNLKHTNWNPTVASFILKEYHQMAKLTQEELEVMHVLMNWPQEFWQVGLQYYYENLPWPKERFLRKLESKVNARLARGKFLKDFPERNGVFKWKLADSKKT